MVYGLHLSSTLHCRSYSPIHTPSYSTCSLYIELSHTYTNSCMRKEGQSCCRFGIHFHCYTDDYPGWQLFTNHENFRYNCFTTLGIQANYFWVQFVQYAKCDVQDSPRPTPCPASLWSISMDDWIGPPVPLTSLTTTAILSSALTYQSGCLTDLVWVAHHYVSCFCSHSFVITSFFVFVSFNGYNYGSLFLYALIYWSICFVPLGTSSVSTSIFSSYFVVFV